MIIELSGGRKLVGGGGGMRTEHLDGLSWSTCQSEPARRVLGISKEK